MKSSILFRFPTELWDLILSFIPNSLKSFTTHSLFIIFYQKEQKQSIISNYHLFHSINLISHSQLKVLINSFQSNHQFKTLPRTFSLKAWRLKDNHLLINLLNQISYNLRAIELHIGPLFGPDQLEEIFENEKSNLKVLSLRFNQNVSKRSYEPFLKGAYFDSTIDLISKWSIKSTSLRSFSFIQDPAPPPIKMKKIGEIDDQGGIAQPIILFRFESLKNFTISSIGNQIQDLRIRIPKRNLLPSLTQKLNHLSNKRLSKLKTLDLSTTFLNHQSVLTILRTYPSIEHLILDRTHVIVPVRFDADQERVTETLKNIGMSVATVGISRALDANRAWREVVEEIQVQRNLYFMPHGSNRDHLRDSSHGHASSGGSSGGMHSRRNHTRVKKPGRSAFASGPMKQTVTTSQSSSSKSQLDGTSVEIQFKPLPSKIVIIPSKPKLKTLNCGTTKVTKEVRNQWKEWFEESYIEGIEKYIKNVYEKIHEYERNLEIWKSKKHRKTDEEEEKEKEDDDDERTKPLLLKFNDDYEEEDQEEVNLKEIKQIKFNNLIYEFFTKFNLKISSIEETLIDLQPIEIQFDLKTCQIPIFCSIPDCKRLGKVIWDQDRKEIDLIRIGKQLNKLNIKECIEEDEVEKNVDLEDDEDEDEDELAKDDAEHSVGCGHFINRRIWDSEYW